MIWRVGDGSQIRVWTDPWLPRTWARRPLTRRGNNLISRVDELVDPTTGSWDVQLVKDTFLEVDAKLILSLPIHTDLPDSVAWHFDAKGLFSVRSAYKVKREADQRASARQAVNVPKQD